ncbi:GumC family protein [uncultured Anaeromusa sp.]|uniref:GumC family protein n=1 Tax=uncultured Anaeromusa sp. TaxID=673273 RepID=UPI0029C745F4|nr:GumC family protein [uncultured Anaeromusa sp.]
MEEKWELRQLVDVVRRHSKIIYCACALFIGAAFALNHILPPQYQATATMRVKYSRSANDTVGTMNVDDIMRQQIYTYAEVMKSRTVVEAVIEKYYGDQDEKPSYDAIIKRIEAQPVKNSEILNVTVQANSAEEAQSIANLLIETFNERLTEIVRAEGKGTRVFLGDRLAEAKRDLDKVDKALVDYKKKTGAVVLSKETNLYLDKQMALVRQDSENRLALAAGAARVQTNAGQMSRQSPGAIADNALIQQLKNRLAEQEVEMAGLRKTLTANHPRVTTLQATLAETRNKLKAEVAKVINQESPSVSPVHQTLLQNRIQAESDLAVAGAQRSAIDRMQEESKRELLLLPAKEQGLARLLLDYSIAEQTYTMLAKKYEEARISEVTQPTNAQVVDMASLPETPVKPRKMLNLAVGLLLGLFSGVTGTFIAEYFYKTIDTARDVRKYLGLEVIGGIPGAPLSAKTEQSCWARWFGISQGGRRVKRD